ncbi:NlpC/P60 family protein [Kutzneria buriramensis]|uniref:Cell wall-associated NlpC family hydrolase n=1 Tax=Kutzneria buriramensis TaxID=1045776 RepID=A0A3E0I6J1_9PSEU|nr:NlpC/P60 family protein [Kutzneria buriramensis]REH54230.1 cell wall-associated NlpC family hydrolase [Kutzneria buriramensis]
MVRVRATVLAGVVLAVLVGAAAPGAALPPPPSNPSDSDISAGQDAVKDKAAKVGDLSNQVAAADAKLSDLQDQVEARMEEVNKARVDLEAAQAAAKQAGDDASAAKLEADAAARATDDARKRLDDFAAASFSQGSAVGGFSALFDATSPDNLLARVQMLNAVSATELKAMDVAQRADVDRANKDSAARKALEIAKQKQDEADAAKKKVDAAMAAAIAARQAEADQEKQLQASRSDMESQLSAAQANVTDLQAQRQRYDDWQAEKKKEDEAAAAAAAAAAASRPVANRPAPPSVPVAAAGRAAAVIARAMAELGMPYAWGGGTPSGPSRGFSDGGGDADYYGDYNKIGFDCSGLMVYAFAGVGIYLPHYSGYQYYAGAHVPLSQMAPGDMLFYGNPSDIHHVTMYIGGGRMIEAPYSGSYVRVVPVRWGEIMPYATRVL